MRAVLAALVLLGGLAPAGSSAWPHHSYGSGTSYRSSSSQHRSHVSTSPGYVRSDANGKIHRDPAMRAAFRYPCPSTGRTRGVCPGCEVDHVLPLACGGADDPSNMQWLTKEANRAKGVRGMPAVRDPEARDLEGWDPGDEPRDAVAHVDRAHSRSSLPGHRCGALLVGLRPRRPSRPGARRRRGR